MECLTRFQRDKPTAIDRRTKRPRVFGPVFCIALPVFLCAIISFTSVVGPNGAQEFLDCANAWFGLVTSGLHFLICRVTFSAICHILNMFFGGWGGVVRVWWAGRGSGMGACFLHSTTQLFDFGSVVYGPFSTMRLRWTIFQRSVRFGKGTIHVLHRFCAIGIRE